MSDFLNQLREILVSAAAAAVIGLLTVGTKYLKTLIEAKIAQVKTQTSNDLLSNIMDQISKVCDDVSASFDPIAEKIKAAASDGKLTEDEIADIQSSARDEATIILNDIFSTDTLKSVGITSNILEDLISNAIEASLQKRKLQKPN